MVEHHQAYQLLPHYRVMTSKFKVNQIHCLNLCALQLVPNTKMDHIAEESVVSDLCFEETEYIIDGVTVPFTVSTIKGTVHCIQCRNTTLFGGRDVWVQTFEEQKESDHSMESEIINLVEQQEVYQLLPYYRVLTSKFKVIQSFAENKVFDLWLTANTKMDHIGDVDVDTVDDSCFAQTEYKINEKVVPHCVSSVIGIVKRIECRNIKLFGDRLVWVQEFDYSQDVKEKKVGLAVFKERGHYRGKNRNHPNNLLDRNQYTYYWSKPGSPHLDWIIFKLEQQRSFYPTKIMIVNNWNRGGIKSMTISWSVNGEEYHTSTRIDDIQRDSEDQWFDLEQEASRSIFALGKLQYLKLNFVENHGNDSNSLCQFALFGFSI